jgi:hypothetical protein
MISRVEEHADMSSPEWQAANWAAGSSPELMDLITRTQPHRRRDRPDAKALRLMLLAAFRMGYMAAGRVPQREDLA